MSSDGSSCARHDRGRLVEPFGRWASRRRGRPRRRSTRTRDRVGAEERQRARGDGAVGADVDHRRDPDQGEVAVAARQLLHRDARRRRPRREADLDEQLVGRQRGGQVALEEVGGGDQPLAPHRPHDDAWHRRPARRRAARRRDRRGRGSRTRCRGCGWRRGRSAAAPAPAGARHLRPARRPLGRRVGDARAHGQPAVDLTDAAMSSDSRAMSTRWSGCPSRSAISGIRLWPPASTLTSSCSARMRHRLVDRVGPVVREPRQLHPRRSPSVRVAVRWRSGSGASCTGTLGCSSRRRRGPPAVVVRCRRARRRWRDARDPVPDRRQVLHCPRTRHGRSIDRRSGVASTPERHGGRSS